MNTFVLTNTCSPTNLNHGCPYSHSYISHNSSPRIILQTPSPISPRPPNIHE
ncbi:hypothetical protein BofuT4_P053600.1 [Botrytis cinerea T4]|uniref:Uncharacterized protein n=1 Tax=Botryotinia fuckeliana (strain T4) TaxID=999810 RepID=G2XVD9_BOTF4|nr:hypothetical protein BofuT4_P053600.1 [Botrytis cinerea T4]